MYTYAVNPGGFYVIIALLWVAPFALLFLAFRTYMHFLRQTLLKTIVKVGQSSSFIWSNRFDRCVVSVTPVTIDHEIESTSLRINGKTYSGVVVYVKPCGLISGAGNTAVVESTSQGEFYLSVQGERRLVRVGLALLLICVILVCTVVIVRGVSSFM